MHVISTYIENLQKEEMSEMSNSLKEALMTKYVDITANLHSGPIYKTSSPRTKQPRNE